MFKVISRFFPLLTAICLLVACNNESSNNSPQPKNSDNTSQTILDNGVWREATPESVNLKLEPLRQAFDYALQDGSYAQGAVLIKDGKLVYESYRGITSSETATMSQFLPTGNQIIDSLYASRDKHDVADSWSVAKSFTGVLIGIAIEQGYIKSLQEPASNYITEWSDDDRVGITIRNLLDMRSGLSDIGNSIVLAENQMDACINRELNAASSGATKPWLYSNCDSMVLGEILYRATGKDLQDYADINLFSKIGISAQWWRDNSDGQVGGNRLAYCCLDATPRDFAKFGQLILNNGLWDGEQIIPTQYMEAIKGINAQIVATYPQYNESYGLQFWSFSPVDQPSKTVYHATGANGQYIMIDFDNQMVIVRNSLYKHFSFNGGDKKMKVPADFLSDLADVDLTSINFPISLPGTTLTDIDYDFDYQVFHEKLVSSIQ